VDFLTIPSTSWSCNARVIYQLGVGVEVAEGEGEGNQDETIGIGPDQVSKWLFWRWVLLLAANRCTTVIEAFPA